MRAFGRVYSAWAYGQTVSNLYFRPPIFIVRLTPEFSGTAISNTFTVESELPRLNYPKQNAETICLAPDTPT